MKLFTKTDIATGGQRELGGGTAYDIPTGTITWLSIIYLLVQTTATSVGNYLTDKPKRDVENQNFALKEQNLKIQFLQRALEIDSPADRRATLQLLVKAGILSSGKNNDLSNYIDTGHMPKWPHQGLETLEGFLKPASVNSSPAQRGADTANKPNVTNQRSRQPTP